MLIETMLEDFNKVVLEEKSSHFNKTVHTILQKLTISTSLIYIPRSQGKYWTLKWHLIGGETLTATLIEEMYDVDLEKFGVDFLENQNCMHFTAKSSKKNLMEEPTLKTLLLKNVLHVGKK